MCPVKEESTALCCDDEAVEGRGSDGIGLPRPMVDVAPDARPGGDVNEGWAICEAANAAIEPDTERLAGGGRFADSSSLSRSICIVALTVPEAV